MPETKSLVLPAEAVASSEPQMFAGFPGVFTPGEPVSLEQLGLTVTQARDLIRDHNLPLELSEKKAKRQDDLPVAGAHFDESKLEPGEPIPALDPAGKIASSIEGKPVGEYDVEAGDMLPEPSPLPAEAVAEHVAAAAEPTEIGTSGEPGNQGDGS